LFIADSPAHARDTAILCLYIRNEITLDRIISNNQSKTTMNFFENIAARGREVTMAGKRPRRRLPVGRGIEGISFEKTD
jgi:hypothetical protein